MNKILFTLIIPIVFPGIDAIYKLRTSPTGVKFSEGIRDEPINAPFIELVGAQINRVHIEPKTGFASVRFHLPEHPGVMPHLSLREKAFESFYRLDAADKSWAPGQINQFFWPAKVLHAVHADYPDLLNNVAGLVRLQSPTPALNETIAPILLDSQFSSRPKSRADTTKVKSYTFHFSINFKSEVFWQLVSEDDTVLESGKVNHPFFGTPLSIKIKGENMEPGPLQLKVTAINRTKYTSKQYTASFHHVEEI